MPEPSISRLSPQDSAWKTRRIEARLAEGLQFGGVVEGSLLPFVFSVAGGGTLEDAIKAAEEAALLGSQTGELRRKCIELAKTWVRWGMLLPQG